MTANGRLAFSGDAAAVVAGAALELSERTISCGVLVYREVRPIRARGRSRPLCRASRVDTDIPQALRQRGTEQNVLDAQTASAPAARPRRASSDGKEAVGPSACSRTIRRQRLQCVISGHSPAARRMRQIGPFFAILGRSRYGGRAPIAGLTQWSDERAKLTPAIIRHQ